MVDLFRFLSRYTSFLVQLAGFFLLICGMCIYNDIIFAPLLRSHGCLQPSDSDLEIVVSNEGALVLFSSVTKQKWSNCDVFTKGTWQFIRTDESQLCWHESCVFVVQVYKTMTATMNKLQFCKIGRKDTTTDHSTLSTMRQFSREVVIWKSSLSPVETNLWWKQLLLCHCHTKWSSWLRKVNAQLRFLTLWRWEIESETVVWHL